MTETELIEFLQQCMIDGSDLPTEPCVNVPPRYQTADDRPDDKPCRLCPEPARTAHRIDTPTGERWLNLCPAHSTAVSHLTRHATVQPAESHHPPPAGESTRVDTLESVCTVCSQPMNRPVAVFTADWPAGRDEQRPCSPRCATALLARWARHIDDAGPRQDRSPTAPPEPDDR
ncbi:hypothetical protein [Amycolatopsis sp. NPDC049868]|uniref:hypothetical protein n=1 Tax=Amycolatopsis sp. NPDC049868 TaxID=3363934 RepID=UPI00379ABF8D